ncbi:DUF4407 domain-containing protein [Empedobacter falsenii]
MKQQLNEFFKFFLFFSSEDYYFIELYKQLIQKDKKNKRELFWINLYFTIIGVSVFLLFLLTTISFIFFVYNVLEGFSKILSIPIGLFCGILIANIYYFLLYTISPILLPTPDKKVKKDSKVLDFSNKHEVKALTSMSFLFRFVFITFIACFIAQPISVFFIYDLFPEKFATNEITEIKRYRANTIASSYILKDNLLINKEKENIIHLFDAKDRYLNLSKVDQQKADSITYFLDYKYQSDQLFIDDLKKHKQKLEAFESIPIHKRNLSNVQIYISQVDQLINQELNEDSENIALENPYTFDSKELNKDVHFAFSTWKSLTQEKLKANEEISNVFKNNSFYTLKIKLLLDGNMISYSIMVIFIFLFSVPVYLKFLIRKKSKYYNFKASLEKKIIIEDYKDYLELYTNFLTNRVNNQKRKVFFNLKNQLELVKKYNEDKSKELEIEIATQLYQFNPIEKYEYWLDPPFRTIRSPEEKTAPEIDLITKIYNQ